MEKVSTNDTELVGSQCQKNMTVILQLAPFWIPMHFWSFFGVSSVSPHFLMGGSSTDGMFDAADHGAPLDAATVGNPSRSCLPWLIGWHIG